MNAARALIGSLLLLLLSGCGAPATKQLPPSQVPLQLVAPDGQTFTYRVEQAITPGEQQKGLKGRTALPLGSGMLFTFPESQILSFWMQDTLIELEILFFDDAGRFVSAATMQPCPPDRGAQCPSTLSSAPARYALELPVGSMQAMGGAGEGWRLSFPL